jgi:hypothetical protein
MIFKGKQISLQEKKRADLCKLGKGERGMGNSTVTTEMVVIQLFIMLLLHLNKSIKVLKQKSMDFCSLKHKEIKPTRI